MSSFSPEIKARFRGLRRIVGNTPLLALEYRFQGRRRTVFAKSENLNMTGSVKDRVALHVLYQAHAAGAVAPGTPLVVAGDGNLGISMAALGRALGHPVHICTTWGQPPAWGELLRSFGATVHATASDGEAGPGGGAQAQAVAAGLPGAFVLDPSSHDDSWGAHEASTGPEIHWQLGSHGLTPDAFVAGVGTGATVRGVGRYLREHHAQVAIHPLEATGGAASGGGQLSGAHRIQGLGHLTTSSLLEGEKLDPTIHVEDGDAILMAKKLAAQMGLGVGISAGANFLGAVRAREALGDEAVVVTVLCDSNKKYLATLLDDEPGKAGYLAPQVELVGFTAYDRVCQMCDQADDLMRMAT